MKITFRCPPELEGVLPKPMPAKRAIPDWLKTMPMVAHSDDLGGDVPTVKQCPPFIDAMSYGFTIPLVTDVEVDGDSFSWDWDVGDLVTRADGESLYRSLYYGQGPLGYHSAAQAAGTPLFEPGMAFVKFLNFWTIALDPGCSIFVIHPANRYDLPFRTLSGLVDCDRYVDNFVHFPALWTEPGFRGVLKKGTPIAQCLVVRRESYDLAFEPMIGAATEAVAQLSSEVSRVTGVYRERFRQKK